MNAQKEIDLFFEEKIMGGNSMAPLFSSKSKLEFDEYFINYLLYIFDKKNIDINACNLKYPYKPFLLLSICNENKTKDELFNKWIKIDETITKNFFNFVTNDYILFGFLKNHKNKEEWDLIFDWKKVYNNVIKTSPVKHLESKWFQVNDDNVLLNFENPSDLDVKYFQYKCEIALKKALPWNKDINSWHDLLNADENVLANIRTNGIDVDLDNPTQNPINLNKEFLNHLFNKLNIKTDTTNEKAYRYDVRGWYQHIYRKLLFNRDKKCLICCINNTDVLEACHIKPYSKCNDIEKFDINNGLTLCANHHKLFDSGLFTFDDTWNVKMSKNNSQNDDNLFFLQYEDCWTKIFKNFPNPKNLISYLKYHQNNIFQK